MGEIEAPREPKILENHNANLTEELSNIEEYLEKLQKLAEERRKSLRQRFDEIQNIHRLMGTTIDAKFSDPEIDLTMNRITDYDLKLTELRNHLNNRVAAVVQLVIDVTKLMRELDVAVETEFDMQVIGSITHLSKPELSTLESTKSSVGVTQETLNKLTDRANDLQAEKKRREAYLLVMGSEIAELWDILRVPQEEQLAFSSSIHGITMTTIQKGELELERLRKMKHEQIGIIIGNLRADICQLWDSMSYPEELRNDFNPYFVSELGYTEDLMNQHRNEVQRLREKYRKYEIILQSVLDREEKIKCRERYEELRQNLSNLLSKRDRDSAQQVKEYGRLEQIEKRIPSLTKEIKENICEYVRQEGIFYFNGQNYLETIDIVERDWAEYKEKQKEEQKTKKKSQEVPPTPQPAQRNSSSTLPKAPPTPSLKLTSSGSNDRLGRLANGNQNTPSGTPRNATSQQKNSAF